MSVELSQKEADDLIKMPKLAKDSSVHTFPQYGGFIEVPLLSFDYHEEFRLTFRTGIKNTAQMSWQNMARKSIVLVRLDLNGPPHANPQNSGIIPCPHWHQYVEGWGDSWAHPIDPNIFTDITDVKLTLSQFLACCNVVKIPHITLGLFT